MLTQVLSDREPLDQVLDRLFAEREFSPATRAWLYDVCSGTLRWKGRLDMALDSTATKKKPSGWLRKTLLIAAYQLIAQDRSHASLVVSETVTEVKKRDGLAPSRFANACLRKIADHAPQWRALECDSAEQASLPPWLWEKLLKQKGKPWLKAFAGATLDRPVTWIRHHESKVEETWLKSGSVEGAFEITESGSISEKPGFKAGYFFVQDISSQILVSEISKIVKQTHGLHPKVLDLCSAPGGKTVGMHWNGLSVTASDLSVKRSELVRENVDRLSQPSQPPVRILEPGELSTTSDFDLVWIDAPCSGTGIIRRHPDVKWLREPKELRDLKQVQEKILLEGWKKVKAGGYLAYSVCSVLDDEGIQQIEKFAQGETIRTWSLCPQESPGGDGFWATLLRKS